MQAPLSSSQSRQEPKAEPSALTYNSSVRSTLTPQEDLITAMQGITKDRVTFADGTFPAELKGKLTSSTLTPERVRTLCHNAVLFMEEMTSNAWYYGLYGFNGDLRDTFLKLSRLLECTPEDQRTLDCAADFIAKLSGKSPGTSSSIPTSPDEIRPMVNAALEAYFSSKSRFGLCAEASATIRDGNLILEITEPSGYDLLAAWKDEEAHEAVVAEENLESVNGRGVFICKFMFPEDQGCSVTDCGRKGFLRVTCPLVEPASTASQGT